MLKITVRSFAMIREIIGSKRIELELEIYTLEALLNKLISEFPDLEVYLRKDSSWSNRFLYLINRDKLSIDEFDSRELLEGDEVTILPPAGGGLEI